MKRQRGPDAGCRGCGSPLTDDNWSDGLRRYNRYMCNACYSARQCAYYHADPEGAKKKNTNRLQRMALWDEDRRKKERDSSYNRQLRKKYGIDLKSLQLILEAQNGCCAICHKPLPSSSAENRRDRHLDHCHLTGKIRGVLCQNCNRMLGMSGDSGYVLRNAADYILRIRSIGEQVLEQADHKLANRAAAGGKKY